MAGLVAVLGNGVSIAANDRLQLDALTAGFLERHAEDREALDRLLAEVDLRAVDPQRDFEGIVAGLESAEEVVRAFMQLAGSVTNPELRDAAAMLRDTGVPSLIRRLYYAYCADVLHAIGDLTRGDLAESLVRFCDWLKALYELHGLASIFTLNYDLLLERALIDEDVLGLRGRLTDFFSGLPQRGAMLPLGVGGAAIQAWLYYPADPPERPIQLHHLHGCLTHFRELETNEVYKIASSDLRGHDIFGRLAAAENSAYVPSIILGSRKIEKSREWPFAQAFLALEALAPRADTIVIAGYSFRDGAVNARLRNINEPQKRWIVIDNRAGEAAEEFAATARAVIGDTEIEFALDGIGGALPEVR
jgi:SIR2-like domain